MASQEWGAPLLPWMVEAMHTMGFEKMTPVQASTIPLLAGNKDVVVEAVTGSGKTLAFLLPALIRLSKLDPVRMGQTNVVIISPTRELAQQTFRVLNGLIGFAPQPKLYKTQLITGGTSSLVVDVKNFLSSRPPIVVATPGRLLEFLKNDKVKTNAIDLLVLDEADRLLDLGIDQTITQILHMMPKQKRVGLFSATMGGLIEDIVRLGMRNPVKISVKSANALPQQLSVKYVTATPAEKLPKVINLLQTASFSKAIVYLPTCTSVTYWYMVLNKFITGTKIFSMHGKLAQGPRVKTLEKFTECNDRCFLLTTDVAARGLDIPDVDYVLQLDPPLDANMFVHRAGRTARAGKSGQSIVVLNDDLEQGYVDFMAIRRVPMEELEVDPGFLDSQKYLQELQPWVKQDRARHDLAVRSFLSYIRFYMKHPTKSIFRVPSLDLVAIARSFGILRMPRMPELKDREDTPQNGWLVDPFDFDGYSYQDKQQEAARQAKQASAPSASELESRRKAKERNANAWSDKTERKDTAAQRREKRLKRAISKKQQQEAEDGGDSDSDNQQDWKELVQAKKKRAVGPSFDL